MIRKSRIEDINLIMDIWLNTNISAHDFIPAEYWRDNFDDVKEAIQNAEVYVYEIENKIRGFIGLMDNYIAGLFVMQNQQSRGIGTALISYAKHLKRELSLNVYAENEKAVDFYIKQSFIIKEKMMDEDTNHLDYLMSWKE